MAAGQFKVGCMNLNIQTLNTLMQKGKANVDFVKCCSSTCLLSEICSMDEEANCF